MIGENIDIPNLDFKQVDKEEKCKWKHMGGCMIPGCVGYCITDYEYYYKDLMIHKAIFTFVRTFKFCPLCGKPIELPYWMKEDDGMWRNRFEGVSDNMVDIKAELKKTQS